jgi:hypothetical protein
MSIRWVLREEERFGGFRAEGVSQLYYREPFVLFQLQADYRLLWLVETPRGVFQCPTPQIGRVLVSCLADLSPTSHGGPEDVSVMGHGPRNGAMRCITVGRRVVGMPIHRASAGYVATAVGAYLADAVEPPECVEILSMGDVAA